MFPLKPISLLKVSLLEDRELLRERDGQRQREASPPGPPQMVTQLDRARGRARSSFLPPFLPSARQHEKNGKRIRRDLRGPAGHRMQGGRDGMAVKDPLTSSAEHIPAKLHLVMRNHLA